MNRLILFLSATFLFLFYSCLSDALPLKIDHMIRQYRSQDRFSGTAMVAHDGDEIYYQGFGFLDREKKIPNTANQMLKIGSIVKDFTAVLILQLTELNKLQLDDTIGKYIDYFPDDISQKVTIRQLLRHESGFGDYLMSPELGKILPDLKSVSDIINLFIDRPLLFEPGTGERYSNSGYTVLGAIIEKITGRSYFKNVEENILKPLSMRDTFFDWQIISEFKQSPKWYLRASTGRFYESPFDEWPSPSGGAYSTGRDLLKFELSLLHDNKLLSDKSKVLLATRFSGKSSKTWGEIIDNPDMVAGKAGGSPGSNAVVINDLGRKYIIVVLANFDEPIAEILGKNIHALIQGKEYPPPKRNIFEQCYHTYQEIGLSGLQSSFENIVREYYFQDPHDFILNRVGYDLLTEERTNEAIEIFKLNTKLFPEIANTWDSLGEAYMRAGENAKAVDNYRKSLELNPENQNAREMIQQINRMN